MSLIETIDRYIYKLGRKNGYKYAKYIPDYIFIKAKFRTDTKERLNLRNPKTFNDKLNWLKLHDRKDEYSVMADKVKMKDYVAERIGSEYVIPIIGVYDSVQDVPFDELPEQFVIKCNHNSNATFICSDKKTFDFDTAKKVLSEKLELNYFWKGREWPYKNIDRKIIVEKFLCDENGNYPLDYKLFCFNGKMQFFKVDYNRFTEHRANYYNRNLELQTFGECNFLPDFSIEFNPPKDFEKMIEIADKLSTGIPFFRVDFYYINGKIYIGEFTFYPAGGFQLFTENGDRILGDMLVLPKKRRR